MAGIIIAGGAKRRRWWKAKHYGVAVGRRPGIYTDWDTCNDQVKGFRGCLFKGFLTLRETVRYLNEHDMKNSDILVYHLDEKKSELRQMSLQDYCNLTRWAVPDEKVPDPPPPAKRVVGLPEEETPAVYIDGSCLDNGRPTAKGGIGIYWGENHSNNVSCKTPNDGVVPTNNRAELWAAIAALQQVRSKGISDVVIKSDSRYVVSGITDWINEWKASGSIDERNNNDLWKKLDRLATTLSVTWEHLQGHSGIPGNVVADKLANEGAKGTRVWIEEEEEEEENPGGGSACS